MLNRFTYIALLCSIVTILVFQGFNVQAVSIVDFIVPRGFTFDRNLVKGTTVIPDVYFLQNMLNMSTSTRVSERDSGSNSRLTAYFGDKTESALYRFQTLFKTDIDYEKSISTTTNANAYILNPRIADPYTRAVLNKLIVIYTNSLDQFKIDQGITSTTTVATTTSAIGTSGSKESSSPEKMGFQYSPQGLLLKLIGGNELVDKVYSYTPTGMMSGGGSSSGGMTGGFGGGSTSGGSSASALQPFGGQTTSMTTCTCSSNILLYVTDPRGTVLPLMYQPGVTVLYNMYRPTSGVNVLGQYTSGGQCLVYVGTGCSSGGSPVGTMTQLGTSASI